MSHDLEALFSDAGGSLNTKLIPKTSPKCMQN